MSYLAAGTRQALGRKDIEEAVRFAPGSDKDKLIFPLNTVVKQYMTSSFSKVWAEGRITLEEVTEVLYDLERSKGFNSFGPSSFVRVVYVLSGFLWLYVSYLWLNFFEGQLSYIVPALLLVQLILFWVGLIRHTSKMANEVGDREMNLNIDLLKTDVRFEPRGLKFRAGRLGAWICLNKMPITPEVASDQDYGVRGDSQTTAGVGGFDLLN